MSRTRVRDARREVTAVSAALCPAARRAEAAVLELNMAGSIREAARPAESQRGGSRGNGPARICDDATVISPLAAQVGSPASDAKLRRMRTIHVEAKLGDA